jgi:tetratricopeptide (TPR) repeat protein
VAAGDARRGGNRFFSRRSSWKTAAAVAVLCGLAAVLRASDLHNLTPGDADYWPRVGELEKAVLTDPENLEVGARFRQMLIAGGYFDRSIDFFEKLTKTKTIGPNLEINLALAYVDKVPISGEIRRAYLGRDAIDALTRSIGMRPTVLAYYIRGFINLHFNTRLFHRVDKGIDDLQEARALTTGQTPVALAARVWVTLGDAYWRMDQREKARELWTAATARYSDDPELKLRMTDSVQELDRYINHVFHLATRVDTSLEGALH